MYFMFLSVINKIKGRVFRPIQIKENKQSIRIKIRLIKLHFDFFNSTNELLLSCQLYGIL